MNFKIFKRLLNIHDRGNCTYCLAYILFRIKNDLSDGNNLSDIEEVQDLKDRWAAVVTYLQDSNAVGEDCPDHALDLRPEYCLQ